MDRRATDRALSFFHTAKQVPGPGNVLLLDSIIALIRPSLEILHSIVSTVIARHIPRLWARTNDKCAI